MSYTAHEDAGRVVAALMGMDIGEVPREMKIAGHAIPTAGIADVMRKAGAGGVEVSTVEGAAFRKKTVEGAAFRKKTIEEGAKDPSQYLRFLMGDDSINHSGECLGNANEPVNPGQMVWKWKGMEGCAKETGGRPWAGYKWP